jgi:5-methylcytosine-specific restriction endonuclease McrA
MMGLSFIADVIAKSDTIEQCDEDGELRTWDRPAMWGRNCGYCHEPVELATAMVEIISDRESSICYPDETLGARCVIAHPRCGPNLGYQIPLGELGFPPRPFGSDGFPGWDRHIRSKRWYSASVAEGMDFANELAATLRAEVKAKAEAEKKRARRLRADEELRSYVVPRNPRSISVRIRALIMERDSFTCRRCGRKAPEVQLVVDHIVPVAKGGTAKQTNLQTLCRDCNSGKSDRDPHPHDHLGPTLVR